MKTRKEYEEQLKNIWAQDAPLERVRIDLLLDIRELLMWIKDDILFQRIVDERIKAERVRIGIDNNDVV